MPGNKLTRLSHTAQALKRITFLEERIEEIEKALEESGWIYFERRSKVARIEQAREGRSRIIGRGSDLGEGSGNKD